MTTIQLDRKEQCSALFRNGFHQFCPHSSVLEYFSQSVRMDSNNAGRVRTLQLPPSISCPQHTE